MVKIINIDTKTRTIRISNADGDIKTWRTTESGAHFPIREGESTKEALDKFVGSKQVGKKVNPDSMARQKGGPKAGTTWNLTEKQKKEFEKDYQQPAKKDDVHSRVEKAQRVEAETGVAPEDWEAYENARESGAYNMFDYNAISEDTGLPKELIRKIQENYSTLRDAYGTPDGDDDDDEPAPQPKQGSQPSTADDPRKDGDDAETRAEALWDKYVPDTGPADTLFGEMLRAAGRVKYRYYNDGDMYGNGYGKETVNNAISYLGKLAGGQDTEFKKELSRAVYQATSAASRYDEEEYKRQVDRIVSAFANASWDDIKALVDVKNETDSLTEYPDDTSYDDDDEEDY